MGEGADVLSYLLSIKYSNSLKCNSYNAFSNCILPFTAALKIVI